MDSEFENIDSATRARVDALVSSDRRLLRFDDEAMVRTLAVSATIRCERRWALSELPGDPCWKGEVGGPWSMLNMMVVPLSRAEEAEESDCGASVMPT